MHLRIATRKSALALWQAEWVAARLERYGHSSELVLVDTVGDASQEAQTPFHQLPGQGFFTKAVQEALLDGRADVAVHSHKDLPSAPHGQLELAAVSERADPRDVLLVHEEAFDPQGGLLAVKRGATVGTSAARRRAQLKHHRPDLEVAELRGNVPTRVEKLRRGRYDAVLLAAAGLERLALPLDDLVMVPLEPRRFVPAPAQGVLALECRRDAYEVASVLTDLHDVRAHRAVAAERGLMSMLQGGCQLALGAYAELKDGEISLTAYYEGRQISVSHKDSEGAAMLAFDALGRLHPAKRAV
jgi:hydroxymethylbilane synthase